jgi:cysteine desulfurase
MPVQDQLAASAGSACHGAGAASISPVLSAMGVPPEFAVGTLRLSVGRHTTEEDVDTTVELVLEAARKQGVL